MWKVYILYSQQRHKTYVGSTDVFQRRLQEHRSNNVRSTKGRGPWVPLLIECYPTETIARKREQYLKTSSGRRYLKKILHPIIQHWTGSSTG